MNELGARVRSLPLDVRICLGFFSRLPLAGGNVKAPDFSRSAAGWPLAGAAIATGPAVLLWLAGVLQFPPVIAAALTIAAAAAICGGLHEDGLADAADGFGGGASRERKLEIMRDSRLGTFGALALIFSILVRVLALATIVSAGGAVIAFLGVAVISRSFAVWHWYALPAAREDGLAASTGQPDEQALTIAGGLGLAALAILLAGSGMSAVLAVFLAALAVFAFTQLAQRQIGGQTGDTIGAAQQVAEVALFVGLAARW